MLDSYQVLPRQDHPPRQAGAHPGDTGGLGCQRGKGETIELAIRFIGGNLWLLSLRNL